MKELNLVCSQSILKIINVRKPGFHTSGYYNVHNFIFSVNQLII